MSQSAALQVGDLRAHLDEGRLTQRLIDLVSAPSENPPGNETDVAGIARAACEELGLQTTVLESEPGRPSVVARWGDGSPTLGYCSHIDVVPAGDPSLWEDEPFGAKVADGRLHGRGSSDAKGPIAAALEAVAMLKAAGFEPRGTLELELVADEEAMGFKGAGWLVEQGHIRPDIAIVGEPTSLRVVRAQRGANWMRITTRGKAGHGSAPERGINAVKHMAEIILHLEETLPDITHPVLGGPSIGVGTIHGGEKVNIVPAACVAEIDRRSIPGESLQDIIASVQAAIDLARERFPEIKALVELPMVGLPFEVDEDAPIVRAVADSITEVRGENAAIIGFRGASDARFLFEAGADVVVCGPGAIEVAHTARESIDLQELAQGALAYALSFARLLS